MLGLSVPDRLQAPVPAYYSSTGNLDSLPSAASETLARTEQLFSTTSHTEPGLSVATRDHIELEESSYSSAQNGSPSQTVAARRTWVL